MTSPSKPRVTRTTGASSRFYDVTHADGTTARYPSVTTILGAISKPQLIPWAASQERLAVSEAAADLYAEAARLPHQLPRASYLLALEQRLGQTKAHLKTLAKAAEIGSQCHSFIEFKLRQELGLRVGPEPTIANEALWAYMAFDDFKKAVSLTPLAIEQIVWSRTHGFAGTLDLVATLNTRALLTILEGQGPVSSELAAWLTARETATAVIDFKTGKAIYPTEAYLQSAAYIRAFQEMGHGRVDGGLIIRLPKITSDPGFQVAVVPPARELFPTFLAVKELWHWQWKNEQAYQDRRKREVA